MFRARFACLIALLFVAGCETLGPGASPSPRLTPPPPPPPPRMELGAISGLGAFHTASGGMASCAGQSVALMTDNPHSRARMIALYGAADHAMVPVAQVRARAAKLGPGGDLVNSATCSPDGRFAFGGLQAGGYFLIARVLLERAHGAEEQFAVLQEVQLGVGETRQVRLTP